VGTWTHSVTVNAAAVDVVGMITVHAEENTAKTASFAYAAPVGVAFDPEDLEGAAIVIKHGTTTIFTGTLETARAETESGLINVTATDGLKEYFEGRTQAQILTDITGGKYHRAFFGDRTSGWEQAQNVLQTVLAEVHMNRLGALTLGDWTTSGGTAITDAVYLSESSETAPRGALLNRITLNVEYRFTRLKQRHWSYAWTSPAIADFAGWAAQQTSLPTRDMIQSAADGTGWGALGGIQYITVPDAGAGWTPTDDEQQIRCLQALWTGYKRWAHNVKETYTLTVEAPASIAIRGAIEGEEGVTLVTEFDGAGWDNSHAQYTPAWSTDSLGDYYQDQDDRTEIDDLIECALAVCQHRIWDAHRQNFPQFQLLCQPTIDLADGYSITTDWLSAAGKVYGYEHRLDTGPDGVDLTIITLACPRGGGTGDSDALSAPAAPDTGPVHSIGSTSTTLATRIGNTDAAADDDTDWDGYMGNYQSPVGSPTTDQVYNERFVVDGAAIESDARDELTASRTATYTLQVPSHTHTYTPNPI